MKGKTGLYAAMMACGISLLTGCSEKEWADGGHTASQKVVLEATAETKAVTRSALSDEGAFSWLAGDQIMVYATDDQFHEFLLTEGEGSASGKFTGEVTEGATVEGYAVSPARLQPQLVGEALQLTLPRAYTWVEKQSNVPMLAIVDGESLAFKNLGGIVKLYVRNIGEQGCRIEVSSEGNQIAGTFTVTENKEGEAVIQSVATQQAADSQVIFTAPGNEEEKKAFYLPLPVTGETSIKLNVKVFDAAEDGTLQMDKTATLAIHRKELILMPSLTFPEAEGAYVESVSSVTDLTAALENAANSGTDASSSDISLTINSNSNREEGEEASPTVTVADPIVIPQSITASSNSTEKTTVKLTFDEVPTATEATENVVKITDNQETPEEPQEAQSDIIISIPEATEGVEAPSFDIDLSKSTVTLGATQESATYNEVTATTAENTLVVDKGVTVNRLIIRSGNVKVSGVVKSLVNISGRQIYARLTATGKIENYQGDVVILREGETIGEDFANQSVADGQTIPYEIASWKQMQTLSLRVSKNIQNEQNRLYAECNYVLTADLNPGEVADWVPIGSTNSYFRGTFNGNGHAITADLKIKDDNLAGGLFGYVENATIKNVVLNGSIQPTNPGEGGQIVERLAGICGDARNTTFENCHNNATIEGIIGGSTRSTIWRIGGIAASAVSSNFTACWNTGNINGIRYWNMGGICGCIGSSNLTACYNTGSFSGDIIYTVAGLCGDVDTESSAKGCWAREGSILFTPSNGSATLIYMSEAGEVMTSCYGAATVPTPAEIADMNKAIEAYGWMYNADGTLAPAGGSNIPSTPVNPW